MVQSLCKCAVYAYACCKQHAIAMMQSTYFFVS